MKPFVYGFSCKIPVKSSKPTDSGSLPLTSINYGPRRAPSGAEKPEGARGREAFDGGEGAGFFFPREKKKVGGSLGVFCWKKKGKEERGTFVAWRELRGESCEIGSHFGNPYFPRKSVLEWIEISGSKDRDLRSNCNYIFVA